MTTKTPPPIFSVVIPAYNEAGHIELFVKELQSYFSKENIHSELICINDGSLDQTEDKLRGILREFPAIKILSYKENKGQGFAFREALKIAEGQYIFWLPSDGEIPPHVLKPLLSKASYEQVIVAYPQNAWGQRSVFRILLSKSYQRILRLVFGVKLRYFNAMAIYPRELLQEISWNSNRFFFPAEILIRLSWKKKVHFFELPFILDQRRSGKSQAIKWIALKDILKNLTILWFERWKT